MCVFVRRLVRARGGGVTYPGCDTDRLENRALVRPFKETPVGKEL